MSLYISTPTDVSKEKYRRNFGNINLSLWNVAVFSAPYKTGNLRLNIKKSSSSLDKVMYIYDDLEAAYVNFLEEGIGRNKRHTGFIEFKTVNSMLFELFSFFYDGKPSYYGLPVVVPRTDKLRNYERKMAKALGFDVDDRINASERASLSFGYKKGYNRNKTNNELYKNIASPINTNVQKDRMTSFKPWGGK
jgi:hypothetical protein